MSDPADALDGVLQRYLQQAREAVVGALDGLGDYDVRRPMTPTGTSLLGLVKHLASVELGYLGDSVGRPSGIELAWDNDEDYASGADMYAHADESREWLLDLYRTAWAHSDESIGTLGIDAPATVAWWPEERRQTTLGRIVVHLIAETARHAGHADILRETIDGRGGRDHDDVGDQAWWDEHVHRVQAAAEAHRA